MFTIEFFISEMFARELNSSFSSRKNVFSRNVRNQCKKYSLKVPIFTFRSKREKQYFSATEKENSFHLL